MTTRRERLRGLHINRMIPNMLTLLALAFGLNSIRFALQERWEMAVLAVVVAAVLDGLDGRIARILKGASKFGAELDSLSDFLCFGVAPAVVLYVWALADAGRFGWSLVLLYSICCALRLARFNTALDDPEQPAWTRNFFTGVPAPAGGGLALIPMVLWFQTDAEFLREPFVVAVVMVVVSGLMVSRIRTYSFKKIRIAPSGVLPTMLGIGLYLAFLVSAPWITLSVTALAYVISIPFGARAYAQQKRRAAAATPPATGTPAEGPGE